MVLFGTSTDDMIEIGVNAVFRVAVVDDTDSDDDVICKSARADAICKHKTGVNSSACLGDKIAPKKGWAFVVSRVVVVGIVVAAAAASSLSRS